MNWAKKLAQALIGASIGVVLAVVVAWAVTQTLNTVPTSGAAFLTDLQTFLRNEDAQRYAHHLRAFVVQNGLHGTGAGLTGNPGSTIAYPGGFYATETASITYPDSSVCWVIMHSDTTGNIATFVRVAGTKYLTDCVTASQPAQPTGTVYLMKVTTAAGAISAVLDLRPLTAVGVSQGGTGLATPFVVGDMLYANTTLTWTRLTAVLDGNVLRSAGVSTPPLWGKVRLSGAVTDISGVLPIVSGGTNVTAVGTANQVFGTNAAANAFEHKTLTQGANITITHTPTVVTFAAAPGNVGVRQYGFAFVDANSVKVLRTLRYSGTLAIVADVNGTLLTKNDNDLTLTIPTNLPAAFTLTGGNTFNTTINVPTVTATGSSFTTELVVGDTVIVDIAGAPEEFTVKTVDSNVQFTAWQNAGATLANKSGTRGGVTAASRVPNALYFVYLAASGLNNSYLDTAMPVSGYHPRTTTDRWAGMQVYNNPSNALEQTWTWTNGTMSLELSGSRGGSYTTTSATYVDVDSTNLKRPLYIPPGGMMRLDVSLMAYNSGLPAGDAGLIALTRDVAATVLILNRSAAATNQGAITRLKVLRPASGIAIYALQFKTDGTVTMTLRNETGDIEGGLTVSGNAVPTLTFALHEP